MELGHLLTRFGLTYPEVSSKVCHDSFCQSGSSVSLPWVIYCEAFYLHVVYALCCIAVRNALSDWSFGSWGPITRPPGSPFFTPRDICLLGYVRCVVFDVFGRWPETGAQYSRWSCTYRDAVACMSWVVSWWMFAISRRGRTWKQTGRSFLNLPSFQYLGFFIIIIIIFLHGLGPLTCSGIDALPSFRGASAISSSSRFVVEGVFRESGVVRPFKMVDPVLFVFESHVLYSRDL